MNIWLIRVKVILLLSLGYNKLIYECKIYCKLSNLFSNGEKRTDALRFSKVRTLLKSSVLLTFLTFLGSNCQDILFRIYWTYILMQTVILSPNMWLKMKRKLVMPFSRFSKVRTLLNSSVFVWIFDLLGWKLSFYYL